jgi:hypothetical protein
VLSPAGCSWGNRWAAWVDEEAALFVSKREARINGLYFPERSFGVALEVLLLRIISPQEGVTGGGSAAPSVNRLRAVRRSALNTAERYPQFGDERLQEGSLITITGCRTVSPFIPYRFTVDNPKATVPFHRG